MAKISPSTAQTNTGVGCLDNQDADIWALDNGGFVVVGHGLNGTNDDVEIRF